MLSYLAWFVSLLSTPGSLFFSEVMKLPPCVLCWYQRIAMYPLVMLIAIALVKSELAILKKYILTLAGLGLAIAVYHNLLYYGVIPDSITPCTAGVSCTSRQIEWLGFITIPLMALVAFTTIIVLISVAPLKKDKT